MLITRGLFPINRSSIFSDMDKILEETFKKDVSYPPYNIYKEEDSSIIEMAVTGFKKSDIKIYFDNDGFLTIEGTKEEAPTRDYIHKSLSTKNFTRKFNTSNMIVQSAKIEDGLLTINLTKNTKDISYISID